MKSRVFVIMFCLVFAILVCSISYAQYWSAMPPYNVLWPLWSPALSTRDPVSSVVTPLINSLTEATMLPVQPGLAWDPCQPGLEYNNTPPILGRILTDWGGNYGMNPWPPPYMLDPITSAPASIPSSTTWSLIGTVPWFLSIPNTLPTGFESLIPPFEHFDTPGVLWGTPPFPF